MQILIWVKKFSAKNVSLVPLLLKFSLYQISRSVWTLLWGRELITWYILSHLLPPPLRDFNW